MFVDVQKKKHLVNRTSFFGLNAFPTGCIYFCPVFGLILKVPLCSALMRTLWWNEEECEK